VSRAPKHVERREADFYETPSSAMLPFLPVLLQLPRGRWLEPCAGHGAIPRMLDDCGFDGMVDAWDLVELRGEAQRQLLDLAGCNARVDLICTGQDYLQWRPESRYAVAITNPPFSIAQDIVNKMRAEADVAVALLRLNFLGSRKRATWLAGAEPDVYVLSERPSFTGGGTDATEYAWMVWWAERKWAPRIHVLPPATAYERRKLLGA
jgi:hypothetical protein